MAYITGAVYEPPLPGLPFVAVMFDTKGEVLAARVVPSRAAGDAMLKEVTEQFVAANAAGKIG